MQLGGFDGFGQIGMIRSGICCPIEVKHHQWKSLIVSSNLFRQCQAVHLRISISRIATSNVSPLRIQSRASLVFDCNRGAPCPRNKHRPPRIRRLVLLSSNYEHMLANQLGLISDKLFLVASAQFLL